MQVFPTAKHQVSDQERTDNYRCQPGCYDKFYSPIHFMPLFRPRPLAGFPEGKQVLHAPDRVCDPTGRARESYEVYDDEIVGVILWQVLTKVRTAKSQV